MGKSSKDKRDAYYRLAKEQGWRARSAFKLLHLDEEFDLFRDVHRVVDLCAAPGSWSQVLSRVLINGEKFGRRALEERARESRRQWVEQLPAEMQAQYAETEEQKDSAGASESTKATTTSRPPVKIVSIDLQPMSPLPGIITLKADITHPSTIPRLLQALDLPPSSPSTNTIDLIISDGAPDVTGLHDLDIYVQSQLLWAAVSLACRLLRPGGKFVAKIFRGKDTELIYAQFKTLFDRVVVAKPKSSRASSMEAFVVGLGFKGVPEGMGEVGSQAPVEASCTTRPDGITDVVLGTEDVLDAPEDHARPARWIPPFLAVGSLGGFDADATYQLPKDRAVLEPVQPPTAPPYKRALEMRRAMGGGGGGGVKS